MYSQYSDRNMCGTGTSKISLNDSFLSSCMKYGDGILSRFRLEKGKGDFDENEPKKERQKSLLIDKNTERERKSSN